jgi:hypothetical protein
MAKQDDSEEEDRDRDVAKPSQGGTRWRTALGGAAGGWSDWHEEETTEQGNDKEDRDRDMTSRIDRMMEEWTMAKRQEEA